MCFSTHHALVPIATRADGTSCPCASCMAPKAPREHGRVPGNAAERSPPPAPPNQEHGVPPVKHNQQIPPQPAIVRGWARTAPTRTHVSDSLRPPRPAPHTLLCLKQSAGLSGQGSVTRFSNGRKRRKRKRNRRRRKIGAGQRAPGAARETPSTREWPRRCSGERWCCHGPCSAPPRHREITEIRVPAPWGLNGAGTRGAEPRALPPDSLWGRFQFQCRQVVV